MTRPTTPSLVLLDCQRSRIERPDGGIDPENREVAANIAALLRQARADGWSVCHCQHAGDGAPADRTPIDGLRAHAREAVFVRRGLSAFSDSYFHQILARTAGRTCLLAGFSAPFSILATLFDAETRGVELTLVPEAVGTLAVAPRNVAETRGMAFDLAARIAPAMSLDAIADRWVRAPAVAG
ncbi:MAG: isochorismatase family protein [Pseudomonadota bacterium]|nr:isochorismatase family protein [Pseudomonadota bacterium]